MFKAPCRVLRSFCGLFDSILEGLDGLNGEMRDREEFEVPPGVGFGWLATKGDWDSSHQFSRQNQESSVLEKAQRRESGPKEGTLDCDQMTWDRVASFGSGNMEIISQLGKDPSGNVLGMRQKGDQVGVRWEEHAMGKSGHRGHR